MYIRLPSNNALFDAWLFYLIRLHSQYRSVAYFNYSASKLFGTNFHLKLTKGESN